MLVAGVVVETRPGAEARVAARLAEVSGLEIKGQTAGRLAAVWEAPSGDLLERWAKHLLAGNEDILGIYPAYVGADAEPSREPRA